MARRQRNKLVPDTVGGKIWNLLLNFLWAVVWLLRSAVSFLKTLCFGKGK